MSENIPACASTISDQISDLDDPAEMEPLAGQDPTLTPQIKPFKGSDPPRLKEMEPLKGPIPRRFDDWMYRFTPTQVYVCNHELVLNYRRCTESPRPPPANVLGRVYIKACLFREHVPYQGHPFPYKIHRPYQTTYVSISIM